MAESKPIKIGPFTGGMNTYSDPTAIADTEAVLLENFDVDLDGSLASRPPVTVWQTATIGTNGKLLGVYRTAAGTDYLISSNDTATYATNIATGVITQITTTVKASACVQYDNKIWLVAPVGSIGPGGSWDGITFTAVATMPKGNCCCIYKERMYIGDGSNGGSTLYFSKAADPGAAWGAADFLFVNKGDGQSLTDIKSFNNVVVVFKENSTYIFAYDTAPTRGTVQSVSNTVGVQYTGCVVDYENSMYVLTDDKVYQIQNWNFDQINVKLPFKYINSSPSTVGVNPLALSVLTDRLFVRYFDNVYVYNLKTRAWTTWAFSAANIDPCRWVQDPVIDPGTGTPVFYAFSYRNNTGNLYKLQDGIFSGPTESMQCTLITKTYNVEVPYTFKRLQWWGIDCLAKTPLNVYVSPVAYARPVTWNQIKTVPWNTLGTWNRLLDTSIDVSDNATLTTIGNTRTFIKFIKSLRFRQVSFRVTSTVSGEAIDSPLRIYSLMAVVANKQVLPDKVN